MGWAGTRPSQWEGQLQDLAKEHMGGVDGARSRSEADPDSPYGADITITEPAQQKKKKKSWLPGFGKSGAGAAKPTGKPPTSAKALWPPQISRPVEDATACKFALAWQKDKDYVS